MDLHSNVQEAGANGISTGSCLSKRTKVHAYHIEAWKI